MNTLFTCEDRRARSVSVPRWGLRLLALFSGRPLSALDIAKKAGLSPRTVMTPDYLPALRRAGLIYIADWCRACNHIIPRYAPTQGLDQADAPRLPRLTGAERMAKYAEKRREKIQALAPPRRAVAAKRETIPPVSEVALTALGVVKTAPLHHKSGRSALR